MSPPEDSASNYVTEGAVYNSQREQFLLPPVHDKLNICCFLFHLLSFKPYHLSYFSLRNSS